MSFYNEFKEFALKGSVVDLAIGLIIGNAFGKIVSSLVQDIVMPMLSLLMTNVNLAHFSITLLPAKYEGSKEIVPAVSLQVGTFLLTIIDFIVIALAIFMVIKAINRGREGYSNRS